MPNNPESEAPDAAQSESGEGAVAPRAHRKVGGIPLRAFVPNAVTALALCCGLSGLRAAMSGEWTMALLLVVGAGVLDGIDGRIARLLKANTRFGAELDSLSDVIAFGVAPATILYLWSLDEAPKFGWVAALSLTVCCALRLARFNANIDVAEQPHKSAGFNTGVPAPMGAGLAFIPLALWLITQESLFRAWYVVMPWVIIVALLMISNIATFNWSSMRIRREWRLMAIAGIALVGAGLVSAPLQTLLAFAVLYLSTIPFSILSYRRVRQRLAATPNR